MNARPSLAEPTDPDASDPDMSEIDPDAVTPSDTDRVLLGAWWAAMIFGSVLGLIGFSKIFFLVCSESCMSSSGIFGPIFFTVMSALFFMVAYALNTKVGKGSSWGVIQGILCSVSMVMLVISIVLSLSM